jgi:hypothetical protein
MSRTSKLKIGVERRVVPMCLIESPLPLLIRI